MGESCRASYFTAADGLVELTIDHTSWSVWREKMGIVAQGNEGHFADNRAASFAAAERLGVPAPVTLAWHRGLW